MRRAPLIDLHAGRGGGGRQAVWCRRVFISAVFFFHSYFEDLLGKVYRSGCDPAELFHDLLQKLGLEVNPA